MVLVTRLQNKVKELERDKGRLERELERREDLGERPNSAGMEMEREIYDTIKVFNLTMERCHHLLTTHHASYL